MIAEFPGIGQVGRVAALARFPVKLMAGEVMDEAEVDWQGMEGDRQYGFVRRGNTSRFPWLTARDLLDLVRHRAIYGDPRNPRTSPVFVADPSGREWELHKAGLAEAIEKASGSEVDLLQLGIGAYDSMPLSILTTASLAELDAQHGEPLDRRRFRANIVVESTGSERDWVGCVVHLGGDEGVELRTTYLAPRCAMVTVDPDTAERDARVMRTVAQKFDGAFAIYATVARPGILRVGEAVSVRPA